MFLALNIIYTHMYSFYYAHVRKKKSA